jgi:transcriptional regulator with XRE-family HTH domain
MHTRAVFHIGSVIRALRTQRRIGLIAFARRIGISPTTLSRIERTGQNFERKTLVKIATGLGVTETDLYEIAQESSDGNLRGTKVGDPGKEGGGEAGAEPDDTDVEQEDAHSMPDDAQVHGMITALRFAPPERRDEFVQRCISFAMELRHQKHRRPTGTDPNG